MADKDDAASPAPESADPAPTKRKIPFGVFIGVGLAAGTAGGVLVAGPLLAKKVTAPSAAGAPAEPAAEAKAAEKGGAKKEGGKKEGASTDVPVYVIDNLVLNPAGSGGTRFLLASIGIQMGTSAQNDELKKHDIEVREALLKVLGSAKVEELSEIANREVYKEQIKVALEKMLGRGSVTGLYFSQFVIQ
jgi:flagellar FliL protein